MQILQRRKVHRTEALPVACFSGCLFCRKKKTCLFLLCALAAQEATVMLVRKTRNDANIVITRKHAHLSQQQPIAWEAHQADAELDSWPSQAPASDLLSCLQYHLDNHHHHISNTHAKNSMH